MRTCISHSWSIARFGLLLCGCALLMGCSDGPRRYQVTGHITFKGQPVPVGKIYFNPDYVKGNDGPQGFAEIRDGKFDTRVGGKGTTGGQVIVRIEGFQPGNTPDPTAYGSPLFVAYDVALDMPKQDTSKDFEVPASAAGKLPGPIGQMP